MDNGFKKWLQDYGEIFRTSVVNDMEELFGEIDPEDYQETLRKKTWDTKSLQLFIAYKTEQRTKKLVLATWVLAIGTLILSGLTILLTFLT